MCWVNVCTCVSTLVDDEAVFGQVGSGDAAGVGSQQEQDFGRVLPDEVHSGLVAQIQRSHLTGHSETGVETLSGGASQ